MIINDTVTKAITFATLQSSFSNSSNISVIYDTESLTAIISSAGITVNLTSAWELADSCDRFIVNNNLFYKSLSQTTFTKMNFPSTPAAFDLNLTIALVGNQVWLLDNTTNTFNSAYTIPDAISPLTKQSISIYSNRLIITAFNSTYAQALAYSMNSLGVLTNCLNYSNPNLINGYTSIVFSPKLTKIAIKGQDLFSFQAVFTSYHIDYETNTNSNIDYNIGNGFLF